MFASEPSRREPRHVRLRHPAGAGEVAADPDRAVRTDGDGPPPPHARLPSSERRSYTWVPRASAKFDGDASGREVRAVGMAHEAEPLELLHRVLGTLEVVVSHLGDQF